MKQKLFGVPQYFFVVFFVMTAFSAVFFVEIFRTHTTDISVLVQVRDTRAAAIADQAVANSAELPKTLGFYDALLASNKDVTDPWQGMTPTARRDAWGTHVGAARVGEGSIVRIVVSGNSVNESRILSQKVTTTLERMLGQIYGTDVVTLKSVDGPYSETNLSSPTLWAIASIAGGTMLTILLFAVTRSIRMESFFQRSVVRRVDENIERKFHPQSWEVAEAAKRLKEHGLVEVEAAAKETKIAEPMAVSAPGVEIPKVSETPVTSEQKSFAPSNLPFVDGEFSWESQLPGFGTGEATPEEGEAAAKAVSAEVPQEEQSKGEPTEEELKRRLNQLLQGKL